VSTAGGCLIAVIGCCAVLYVYVFATMISPRIIGWDRCLVILHNMLLTPAAVVVFFGMFALCAGVAIVAVSLRIALGISTPNARQFTSIAVLVTVLLFLTVLLAISM
jgi:hypothetical protein